MKKRRIFAICVVHTFVYFFLPDQIEISKNWLTENWVIVIFSI